MSNALIAHIHTQKRHKIYLQLRAIPNEQQRYREVRKHAKLLVKLNETPPCECKWCTRMTGLIYGTATDTPKLESTRRERAVI